MTRDPAAIAGVADLVSPTGCLDRQVRAMELALVREALADARLGIADVDAVFCSTGVIPSLELAEYLRIVPRWTDSTMTGGSSFEVLVEHAALALEAGRCDVALIVYAENPRTILKGSTADTTGTAFRVSKPREIAEWETPYGAELPVVAYALAASRHMATYGTTREQLAQIAVSTRQWAADNPVARFRDPLTVADVLNSPPVAEPLHRLDCCLHTDGGGALVMTRASRARDLQQSPVIVLGAATAHDHGMGISQMPSITDTPGAQSGPLALERAGVTVADVDVVEIYDSFTITVLLALEDIGFCPKGEGGAFVAEGRLGPGGSLPTNTSGGGLSYAHPGMFGIFLLIEAVRQLRGQCGARQVDNAEIAVAHGCGGFLSCTSTVVLGVDR
jgi:acetyl-CoA acetyltransferase